MSSLIYILWHFEIKRHINYSILYVQYKYIQYKNIQYKYRNLIQSRFSKEFILETAEFVLKSNNCILLNQVMGTAMGTKFAPPYANLSVGFLEETVLFPVELLISW